MNILKVILKLLITLLLVYCVIIMFGVSLFSLFSLSPQTNIKVFVMEKEIPNIISVFSLLYCIISIWKSYITRIIEVLKRQ